MRNQGVVLFTPGRAVTLAVLAAVLSLSAPLPALATGSVYVSPGSKKKNPEKDTSSYSFSRKPVEETRFYTDQEIYEMKAAETRAMFQADQAQYEKARYEKDLVIQSYVQQQASGGGAQGVVNTPVDNGPKPVMVYDKAKQEKEAKKKTVRIFNFKE